jgi:hypothetical protein
MVDYNDIRRLEYNDGTTRCVVQDKEWIIYHCHDGPAITGQSINPEFWWKDTHYTFDKWLEVNDQLTDEEKLMLKLQYG